MAIIIECDSRDEKMLKIIERFRVHPNYKRGSHVMVEYGDDIITFYDNGDEYFTIKYDDIEVIIIGAGPAPGLDFVFDLDRRRQDWWLDEVLLITNPKKEVDHVR